MTTIGWDVGGVNIKAARVDDGRIAAITGVPFELQRAPKALVRVLRDVAAMLGTPVDAQVTHAVTMTAELSQMFRTKREGVAFVLDAIESAFPASRIRVYTVDGRFLAPADARAEPLAVAAANWAATARMVARRHADALLIDIGTTTSDVVPIVAGQVAAVGHTDPGRLRSGELVYSGALRTPCEAIVDAVSIGGELYSVSAESFALIGDVHVWRGALDPADYTCPTPDGRPAARTWAGDRLARVVCADREMLDEDDVDAIAEGVANAQVERIVAAIRRVRDRYPSLRCAVTTGLGRFIADAAASAAGLEVVPLDAEVGRDTARYAPAAAVALLLEPDPLDPTLVVARTSPMERHMAGETRPALVDLVAKLGGGLLASVGTLDATLAAVADIASHRRTLVVPGGGPFADVVRDLDARLALSDTAAHWMAILGMDQYAQLIASRVRGSVLVTDLVEIGRALDAGGIAVLMPSAWLRRVDPLPHSWDVTSDSIAAWVAGEVGARELLLIKPPGVMGPDCVDPFFGQAVPPGLTSTIVSADRIATRV